MTRIFTVLMPDIGEGVMEGEVIDWLKQPGDSLAQDEPVITLMTDKATVELPAPYPGKLAKQYYRQGDTAIKGKPLYDIELKEGVEATTKKRAEPTKTQEVAAPPPKTPKPLPEKTTSDKALAAPPTRKLARELSVDINQVPGTGPEGRVIPEDIHRYLSAPKHAPRTPIFHLPGDREEPLLGIRNIMSKRMAESKDIIPHFSYFEAVDATRLIQMRESFKSEAQKEGITITFMPFFLRALSLALLRYPEVNSSLDREHNSLVIHGQHNIGIAASSDKGLIVPVLKGIEQLSLNDIIRAYDALKKKALEGKLSPSDMRDYTVTISNFGVLSSNGQWATPIIHYPAVAILALARIQKQPVVKNDTVVIRDTLNLSWSFDHRVIDGDLAATFSHTFSSLLQNPATLL